MANDNDNRQEDMASLVTQALSEDPDTVFYLNVTDGLEASQVLIDAGVSQNAIRFSCIQSTHLEQKNLDVLLNRLGPDLIMNLALGRKCAIVDYGTDKVLSRAVYQGVPFVKYALERAWFGKIPGNVTITPRDPAADPRDVTETFDRWYGNLNRRTKSYLRHFRVYAVHQEAFAVHGGDIRLSGISLSTDHDGHPDYYADITTQVFCH